MITTTVVVTDSNDPQLPGKPILRYDVEVTSMKDLMKLIRKSIPDIVKHYAKFIEEVSEEMGNPPF